MASGQLGPQMIPLLGVSGLAVVPPGKLASHHDCRRWFCRRRRHRRQFCQTLSVNADPLDLFDQPLLLDMIFLGTPQLRGGVNIFFFYKVSFEKHPNVYISREVPDTQSKMVLLTSAKEENDLWWYVHSNTYWCVFTMPIGHRKNWKWTSCLSCL